MLRRDLILVQIEELGKVIAQIISQRNSGATRNIPKQIQVIYDSLKIDRNFLLTNSPQEIRNTLNRDDDGGILRAEIAVKTLIEESYLFPEQKIELLSKAQSILEYLQQTDTTFSLERISLLETINSLLTEEEQG